MCHRRMAVCVCMCRGCVCSAVLWAPLGLLSRELGTLHLYRPLSRQVEPPAGSSGRWRSGQLVVSGTHFMPVGLTSDHFVPRGPGWLHLSLCCIFMMCLLTFCVFTPSSSLLCVSPQPVHAHPCMRNNGSALSSSFELIFCLLF